jgi:regulator of sigma E protease
LYDALVFFVLLNIGFGLINLLPVPPLDGGHLMFLDCEALFGKSTERLKGLVSCIGILLLLMLLLMISYHDIAKIASPASGAGSME